MAISFAFLFPYPSTYLGNLNLLAELADSLVPLHGLLFLELQRFPF